MIRFKICPNCNKVMKIVNKSFNLKNYKIEFSCFHCKQYFQISFRRTVISELTRLLIIFSLYHLIPLDYFIAKLVLSFILTDILSIAIMYVFLEKIIKYSIIDRFISVKECSL